MAQPITPDLTVKGAADAIAFYKQAFDAIETARMPAQDGQRLMHASTGVLPLPVGERAGVRGIEHRE